MFYYLTSSMSKTYCLRIQQIENGPAAVDGEVFSKELGITHHKDPPSPGSPSNENKD